MHRLAQSHPGCPALIQASARKTATGSSSANSKMSPIQPALWAKRMRVAQASCNVQNSSESPRRKDFQPGSRRLGSR